MVERRYRRFYIPAGGTLVALFLALQLWGLQIIDISGDIQCSDVCVSYFDVRNPTYRSIYIYNKNDTKLDFEPEIKDYELYVKYYGKWVLMDFTMETRLGNIPKDRIYTFVFPRYSTKHFKLVGRKNPRETIKWGFGFDTAYLDPLWMGYFNVLNDLNESRTYEYQTTANITANVSVTTFIDILDNTGRYRNQASPFNYTIDILRTNEFTNGSTSMTISSGDIENISIDNRTDLYNASLNLTGNNNPNNLELGYGVSTSFTRNITNTLSFQPNSINGTDTRIVAGAGTTNYGTATILAYRETDNQRPLMSWNFTYESIPSGATITKVTLEFNVQFYIAGLVSIHPMNHSWIEVGTGGVTWDNCGGGGCVGWWNDTWNIMLTSGIDGTGKKNITLNVTWYQNELAKPLAERYGIVFIGAIGGDTTIMESSDHATAGLRPKLYVEYTVEETVSAFSSSLIFPGTLIGNDLYQNLFIFDDVLQDRLNLSFISAGSKTILVNFSTEGNLFERTGVLNFTITAFDLDVDNDFDYIEPFNNSDFINLSGVNTSSPISVFENFENNETDGMWEVDQDCGGQSEFSTGNTDDWYIFTNSHSGGSSSGSSCTNKLDYTSGDIGLNNISSFNISLRAACQFSRQNGHTTGLTMTLRAEDDSTDLEIYTIQSCSGAGFGSGSTTKDVTIHGFRNSDGTWDIYENSTLKKGGFSLITLDDLVRLRFQIGANGNTGGEGGSYSTAGQFSIYNFNTSGIRLDRSLGNYSTDEDAFFESATLATTTNDITRVFLTAEYSTPTGTSLAYSQSSNNNGSSWENVTLGAFHTFITTGNSLKVKFILNSSNNTLTPIIRSYRAQIIPAIPSGLVIVVGSETGMEITQELNSTTTPIQYNGTDLGINKYINSSCSSASYCAIPISFSIGGGGILQISNLNLTQNINPVRFNTTLLQDLSQIILSPTYTGGTVTFDDVEVDFRGSTNITVVAHDGTYANSLNRTIFVKYSPSNISFIEGVGFFDVIYSERNMTDVEPEGQNSSHGIFQIRSTAYDGNIDIYARYNASPHVCLTQQEFRGQNFSISFNNSLSTLNITNLTTDLQPIVTDLNSTAVGNIRSYNMINCSAYNFAFIPFEYFCFNSLCSECVITQDFKDDCDVII